MTFITFGVKIDPRVFATLDKAGNETARRLTDNFLNKVSNNLQKTMQKMAPKRSGALRAGIKIVKKEKLGGGLDRRARIRVNSTAPHSRYVVAGVGKSVGDGTPGTGRYVGPGSRSTNYKSLGGTRTFRASRNFKSGNPFRSAWGVYPGFEGNDFITRAGDKVYQDSLQDIGADSLRITSETFRRLGILYGS